MKFWNISKEYYVTITAELLAQIAMSEWVLSPAKILRLEKSRMMLKIYRQLAPWNKFLKVTRGDRT